MTTTIKDKTESEEQRGTEKHYSANEVATLWDLHPLTVRRLFRDEPGVIVIRAGIKKAHGTLRIPKSVLERVHKRETVSKK